MVAEYFSPGLGNICEEILGMSLAWDGGTFGRTTHSLKLRRIRGGTGTDRRNRSVWELRSKLGWPPTGQLQKTPVDYRIFGVITWACGHRCPKFPLVDEWRGVCLTPLTIGHRWYTKPAPLFLSKGHYCMRHDHWKIVCSCFNNWKAPKKWLGRFVRDAIGI